MRFPLITLSVTACILGLWDWKMTMDVIISKMFSGFALPVLKKVHWSHYVIWERTCFSDLLLYRRRPTYNIDILNLFISSLLVLKGLPPFLPLHGCTSRVVCTQKHLRVACIVFLMGRNCHLQMSVLLWIWGWAKIEWNGNRQMPPTQCECGQAANVRSRMQMNVMERLQLRNSMPLEKV